MKGLLTSLIEKINAILQPIKKVLDFNESGKGMAIGKVSEIDGLEIDWETKFNKKNYLRDNIYISKDAIDSTGDAPSANEYSPSIVYRDKNGKQIGYIQASHRTNGNIRMAVVASRNINGANKTSGIWMDVDASGNSVYGMTNPAKFLEALGINDYIVEQGTSGIWTYRKWNSGIAECWANPHNTTFVADGSLMGGYLFRGGYSFPSGLFIEAPEGYVNGHTGSGVGWGQFRNASKESFTAYICGNQNTTSVTITGMRATGRWK